MGRYSRKRDNPGGNREIGIDTLIQNIYEIPVMEIAWVDMPTLFPDWDMPEIGEMGFQDIDIPAMGWPEIGEIAWDWGTFPDWEMPRVDWGKDLCFSDCFYMGLDDSETIFDILGSDIQI